jgi:hypothetical protein
MSEPAHFNEVRLCGAVEGFFRVPSGTIRGVILRIEAGGLPAVIPGVAAGDLPGVERGDKRWVRGQPATEKTAETRYAQAFVVATHVAVLRRQASGGGR